MKINKNIEVAKEKYKIIKHSKVSWRRKSSYRKPIKRQISKLTRKFLKVNLLKELNYEV